MSENYNLFYFFKQFPDEDACRKYLENADGAMLLSVRIVATHKRFTAIKTERLSSAHTAVNSSRSLPAQFTRTLTFLYRNGF